MTLSGADAPSTVAFFVLIVFFDYLFELKIPKAFFFVCSALWLALLGGNDIMYT